MTLKQTWAEAASAACKRDRDYFVEAVRAKTRDNKMTLIEKLYDLLHQAEHERSHHYTAAVLRLTIAELNRLYNKE